MADNRKEMERAELHRTIWAIADEMRGSVDGWGFKSYIPGMLFYRYISEDITACINRGEWETGNKAFNYADLTDDVAEGAREEMVSDAVLHGKNGTMYRRKTDGGRMLETDSACVRPVDGKDVRLTINIDYQEIADRALREQVEPEDDIEGACLILMETRTGAIRARVTRNVINSLHDIDPCFREVLHRSR